MERKISCMCATASVFALLKGYMKYKQGNRETTLQLNIMEKRRRGRGSGREVGKEKKSRTSVSSGHKSRKVLSRLHERTLPGVILGNKASDDPWPSERHPFHQRMQGQQSRDCI